MKMESLALVSKKEADPGHSQSIHFEDAAYARNFLHRLLSLRKTKQYTDVILKAHNVEIACHKVALSAASEYFNAMFTSGLEESTSGVVEIREIDGQTLESIVDYIYLSEIDITTENVQNLVPACDQFQFDGLKQACERYMLQQLDPSNCIGFFRFSKVYSLQALGEGAMYILKSRFKEVVAGPEFVDLDQQELLEYIKSDDLAVSSEDVIFESVVKWVSHNRESRNSIFTTVMEHVRLPYCSCAYLCHVVKNEPLMSCPICQEYLEEARMYHMLPERKHELCSPRVLPRKSFNVVRRLVIVGGLLKEDRENRYCWFLKEECASWDLLAQLPRPNWKFYSVCVLGSGILLTGGYHSNVKKDCWIFDTMEKKWKSVPAMNEARCKHRGVVHGDWIYVIGGEDDMDRPLSSVERFHWPSRQWYSCPAIPGALSDPLSVSYGRYIYVFGGIEHDDGTSTCTYVFDTVWEQWSKRAEMLEPCRLGSAVVINDQIFIVGGYTRTCMSYDTRVDQWKQLTGPREKHGNAPAVVWNGKILIAGGDVDPNQITSVVEEYDPNEDTWTYWKLPLKEELSCHYMLNADLYGL